MCTILSGVAHFIHYTAPIPTSLLMFRQTVIKCQLYKKHWNTGKTNVAIIRKDIHEYSVVVSPRLVFVVQVQIKCIIKSGFYHTTLGFTHCS